MRFYENIQKTSENRLSPRSYYIPDGECDYILLNGKGNFKYFERDFDLIENIISWGSIDVPSCWQLKGYDSPNYANAAFPYPCDPPFVPDDNPCGVYERNFDIPTDNKQTYFILEGVGSCATVKVNGKYVGFTQGSHLQAEFDLTSFVVPGENTIRVEVTKWSCGSYLEDQDFFRFNSIFRDCYLLRRPHGHIKDIYVRTKNDTILVSTDANSQISLFDANGNLLNRVTSAKETSFTVENPIQWNAERPYLYSIVAECKGEIITQKIGF